jgi:hypothetical protein
MLGTQEKRGVSSQQQSLRDQWFPSPRKTTAAAADSELYVRRRHEKKMVLDNSLAERNSHSTAQGIQYMDEIEKYWRSTVFFFSHQQQSDGGLLIKSRVALPLA